MPNEVYWKEENPHEHVDNEQHPAAENPPQTAMSLFNGFRALPGFCSASTILLKRLHLYVLTSAIRANHINTPLLHVEVDSNRVNVRKEHVAVCIRQAEVDFNGFDVLNGFYISVEGVER